MSNKITEFIYRRTMYTLTGLLIFSSIIPILYKYFEKSPEPFPYADIIFQICVNASYGVIASYFFYIFTVHIPKKKELDYKNKAIGRNLKKIDKLSRENIERYKENSNKTASEEIEALLCIALEEVTYLQMLSMHSCEDPKVKELLALLFSKSRGISKVSNSEFRDLKTGSLIPRELATLHNVAKELNEFIRELKEQQNNATATQILDGYGDTALPQN